MTKGLYKPLFALGDIMEEIKINDRLQTAIPFVRHGKRFADIGTDHAYLPIYLVKKGVVETSIAADINRGPLDKALENIKKYGFENQIKTVLCDGLGGIDSNSVDDIAIFGMGGELIVMIIDDAQWLKSPQKRLILQPMTHPEKLREYLAANGYKIVGETLSLDRGKIYQTICAEYDGVIREYDNFVYAFGEYILAQPSELLIQLLSMTKMKLERKINGKREGGENISYEMNLIENINNYIAR